MAGTARAAGLVVGFCLDRALGDPRRGHPVAGFGTLARRLETPLYADSRAAGAAYTLMLVGGTATVGAAVGRVGGRSGSGWGREMLGVAASTYVVLGGTSLVREGDTMAAALASDDLAAARGRLGHLCARDATGLGADELARATVESLAENTSDAVVAPLVWGALLGVPGLVGYRAANTLDAMVGYRSPRYARFGWAAARLDDLLNLVPARLAALLAVVAAEDRAGAWRVWRRDGAHHPSPNAGQVEAAFAGALGVRLGGANSYAGITENRGVLGEGGHDVVAGDVRRAGALSRRVSWGALVVSAATALVAGRRR
ncbi:cobalamin biosynthesis protein [Nocardioides sp.]|uniref:cobalamin biosynthesis protein n=1 Tax=Nocardioides sp. TaxID=35761 RepID=UPI00273363AB|nr:cobalamin biosynthesis protein [Nocardioides sp.]MDP3890305.1 cobalamin biosynthesis protein [Nocardioides sp.]